MGDCEPFVETGDKARMRKTLIILGSTLLAGLAASLPIGAQAAEPAVSIDRDSTPAGRVFFASGACPVPESPPPFATIVFELDNGYTFPDDGSLYGVNRETGAFDVRLEVPADTEPGEYVLTATCNDDPDLTATAPITITAFEAFAEPTFQVDDLRPVAGQVLHATGTCNGPNEEVLFSVHNVLNRTPPPPFASTTTDEAGRFEADLRLPPYVTAEFVNGGPPLYTFAATCHDYSGAAIQLSVDPGQTPPAQPVDADPTFTG